MLFYLASYGVMNSGAFGVLMLLPSRDTGSAAIWTHTPDASAVPAASGTSAETFDDIAGQGRRPWAWASRWRSAAGA